MFTVLPTRSSNDLKKLFVFFTSPSLFLKDSPRVPVKGVDEERRIRMRLGRGQNEDPDEIKVEVKVKMNE